MNNINKNIYLERIKNGSTIPDPSVFIFPAEISVDIPEFISPQARHMLHEAIMLCRPRRPSFTHTSPSRDELQSLSTMCVNIGRSLADGGAEKQALPCDGGSSPHKPLDDKGQAFDEFFAIARSARPEAFATGVVCGVVAMHEELGYPHSLASAEVHAIIYGFYRLASLVLPSLPHAPGRPAKAEPYTQGNARSRDPMERWRNGHVIFVALTSGLILVHLRIISALKRNDMAAAAKVLDDGRFLYLASAAALRLTGDMDLSDYNDVRVKMAPPHVPEGFSGLFDADHRRLLQLTKEFGKLLGNQPPELSWELEGYWLALNETYSAHRWVCDRLIGQRPSLATVINVDAGSGAETLEAFAKRALHLGGYSISRNKGGMDA